MVHDVLEIVNDFFARSGSRYTLPYRKLRLQPRVLGIAQRGIAAANCGGYGSGNDSICATHNAFEAFVCWGLYELSEQPLDLFVLGVGDLYFELHGGGGGDGGMDV